ncbi:transcriptional regulator [Methanosarcina sp.]|uniref:transcriptional regulator n=1 Tax=Methanosarcina sp. TaxID=2213 RepID=UPI003C70A229
METPCQKIVWDLVPAIRASLAIELVKKGQSQATSAKLLGIAPSAVSQYISGKRGYRIEFQGETKELIEKLAQDLIDNKTSDFVVRICEICVSARGIEKKCNSGCGPEEQANNKMQYKEEGKTENKAENKTEDKAEDKTEDRPESEA